MSVRLRSATSLDYLSAIAKPAGAVYRDNVTSHKIESIIGPYPIQSSGIR